MAETKGKRVTWAARRRDDGQWFCKEANLTPEEWTPDKSKRAEFGDRAGAVFIQETWSSELVAVVKTTRCARPHQHTPASDALREALGLRECKHTPESVMKHALAEIQRLRGGCNADPGPMQTGDVWERVDADMAERHDADVGRRVRVLRVYDGTSEVDVRYERTERWYTSDGNGLRLVERDGKAVEP